MLNKYRDKVKYMNNNIKKFYEALVQLINNCGLPIGTAYFVLKDLLNELQRGYEQAAEIESKEKSQQQTQTVEVSPQIQDEQNITVPAGNITEVKEIDDNGQANTVTENL